MVAAFWPGDIPLLAQAALDAVPQWRFRRITVDGQPATARAELVLFFYADDSSSTRAVTAALHQGVRECQALLDSRRYLDAEPVCSSLEGLAGKIPSSHEWERAVAHRLAGEVYSARGRTSQALEALRAAIKLGEQNVENESRALSHLACARIYASTGDIANAKRSFENAEKALRQLQKDERDSPVGTPRAVPLQQWLDGRYTHSLETVLRELVDCLRQAGRADDASGAQRRLDRLLAGAVAK